ncbi:MAG TPA: transcriptional activator NhaR [Candidatus Binatia bacterium]|nr:transcriptional activator NhaR [Candidatus Binatia bacterium]
MEWLNYHHLLYFWTVARLGGVARASEELRLTQATVSAQLKSLEASLGEKLLRKSGRHLALTDTGKLVFRYADEIFSLGQELLGTLKGRPEGRLARVTVGVADVMPKLVAYQLIEPALRLKDSYRIVCREGTNEELLPALAVHDLDVVLTDAPIEPARNVKAFHHLLGECDVLLFANAKLAATYRRGFPRSLDGAPFLLPTRNTILRRSLDQWFDQRDIRPKIIAEFEDNALLMVFGQRGVGVFVAPSVIRHEVERKYDVKVIGEVSSVRERFYAVSLDRKLKHPAVLAISEAARARLPE